jgi:hypothetical protein
LNNVLREAGDDAWYHRVELIRRGPRQFFITSTNSPRFDWAARLTHLQVGRNLDYIAAGHMFEHPLPPRAQIQFVERETMTNLFSECVLLESLEDEGFEREVVRFNNTKEGLMNDAFERLGLGYRMKWVLNSVPMRRKVLQVMRSPTPPSQEWWNENCFLINTPGTEENYTHILFCSYHSHFRESWPVIQSLYFFIAEDDVVADPFRLTPQQHNELRDYWIEVRQLFRKIQSYLLQEATPEECERYSVKISMKLEELKSVRDKLDDAYGLKLSHEEIIQRMVRPGFRHRWRMFLRELGPSIRYRIWLLLEGMKINILERWKLRKPLVYMGPPIPRGTNANSIWL